MTRQHVLGAVPPRGTPPPEPVVESPRCVTLWQLPVGSLVMLAVQAAVVQQPRCRQYLVEYKVKNKQTKKNEELGPDKPITDKELSCDSKFL